MLSLMKQTDIRRSKVSDIDMNAGNEAHHEADLRVCVVLARRYRFYSSSKQLLQGASLPTSGSDITAAEPALYLQSSSPG